MLKKRYLVISRPKSVLMNRRTLKILREASGILSYGKFGT
jgi:hypothetical protein